MSQLVNHLLSNSSPSPFDFIVSGTFLRTSIDDYLTSHGLSSETTLTLEYVRSVIPPNYLSSFQHDDWVSCVDILSASSYPSNPSLRGSEHVLSGSYDGLIRVWDTSANLIATSTLPATATNVPEAPVAIKTALFLNPSTIAAGGLDRHVTIYKHAASSVTITPALSLHSHTAAITSLAHHAPSQQLLASSLDHTVSLFSLDPSSLPSTLLPASALSAPSTNPNQTSSSKRRRLGQPPLPTHSPIATLTSHTAPVTAAIFHPSDPSVAYSTSLDHRLRTFDLTTTALVDTRTLSHPLTCLANLSSLQLLIAGTSARHISLVDPRAAVQTATVMTLRGHRNYVTSLATETGHHAAGYGLVSGSWDGTVRGWDVRFVKDGATGGVGESVWVVDHTNAQNDKTQEKAKGKGKVFGVAWDHDLGVISGGEDKRVAIHRSPGADLTSETK